MKTFNLDCPNDLQDFWDNYYGLKGSYLANKIGLKGKGAANKANRLSEYAANKKHAIEARLKGDVEKARRYEIICDGLYNIMSDDIKW